MSVFDSSDFDLFPFWFTVVLSYGMLTPVDGKLKMMYVIYGNELPHRARPPEYMSPTVLMRLLHKDSSQNNLLVKIVKNMGITQKHKISLSATFPSATLSKVSCIYVTKTLK